MRRLRRHVWRLVAVALAASLPFVGGCGRDNVWPDRPGPKVAVSFAPIACFAMNVGGDRAVVKNMMTGSGPHHFNPTDNDARLLARADLFLVNGLGLDSEVADKLKRNNGNRNLLVVKLGERIPEARRIKWEHGHDEPGHEGHDHGQYDPHVWLGPDRAVVMVEAIRDELKNRDPGNAAEYENNAAGYADRLRKLKVEGLEMLSGVKPEGRKVVTFHESLAYLADEFGVKVAGVVMKKPGSEPSQSEITTLAEECREHGVRVIAVEPQYTANTSARTVKDELARRGVPNPVLVEIDPLETVTPDDLTPDWYERKMRANLKALAEALK